MNKTGKITVDGITIKKEDGTEETYYIPLNENNILIQEEDVILLLKKYGVNIDKIYHIKYFQEAMTHKSYLKKDFITQDIIQQSIEELGNPLNILLLRDKSYERLEYLGDRVIKLIVSSYLFHRYPDQDEGFMTRLQTDIEDKTNLSKMALDMELNKFFIISKQIETLKGRTSEKFNEDMFESFFGALYSSNGLKVCMLLLLNLLETHIDYSEKLYRNKNYKDQLLRFFHSQKFGFPEYHLIEDYGFPHKKTFIVGVIKPSYKDKDISNIPSIESCISFGISNKKKDAEQKASKMALIVYKVLNDDQYTDDDLYIPDFDIIKLEKELYLQELEDKQKNKDNDFNILNQLINNDKLLE